MASDLDRHPGRMSHHDRCQMVEPPRPSVLRVLVVDDHEVVRGGLVALLERRPAFTVVAQVGTAAEAIEAARTIGPIS
jgi:hypothetical protein